MIYATLIVAAITITASVAGQSPQSTNPAAAENKASPDKPPIEILSHKIGPEYYPMLDSRSSMAWSMAAENGDIPRLPNEPSPNPSDPKERRAQGRPQSSYPRATAPRKSFKSSSRIPAPNRSKLSNGISYFRTAKTVSLFHATT